MKVNQIISEMTAGSVASVSMPIGKTQKRTNETSVPGLKPAEKVMTGTAKKKGRYANSILEGKMKELSMDLGKGKEGLNDELFKKKYGKSKEEMRKGLQQKPEQKDKVEEAKLDEDDLIIVPGQTMKRKTGFVPRGQSRVDHEVEMARSDVLATMKNAKAIYELLRNRSEDEGIEGWVQEKLIKANDYLNSVKEYYDEKMVSNEMTGGVGEGVVGGYPFNADDPRNWAKKKAYDNRMVAKAEREANKPAAMPKAPAAPKLTLDDVWRKIEDVVGRIFPDGDPIDYLAPWLEKHGIRDFKIGEILDRAAKKNGYKDLYDYYDSMKDQYDRDNVAEAGHQSPHAKLAQLKAKYDAALKSPNPNMTTLRRIRDEIIKLEFDLGLKEGVAEGLMRDIKRLVTSRDVRSRAEQEISKAQQASMTGDNKTAHKHFKRYDKLDKLANKKQGVAESLQNDYVFQRVQSGYWGSTPLDKNVVVKAASEDEARAKIRLRKDFIKKLRNGDTVSWRLTEGYKEPTDAAGHAKMAAKIKRMLDDTLADRGDRHGNPDPERLTRAYEYHMEKAKEKSQGVAEGAKVDRMVKHIAKSERESGKSKDEAENIAWATANKRGYLDNKNKK